MIAMIVLDIIKAFFLVTILNYVSGVTELSQKKCPKSLFLKHGVP